MPAPRKPAPDLLLRFVLLAAVVLAVLVLVNMVLVGRLLQQQLYRHEAAVTRDFVQRLLQGEQATGFFRHPDDAALAARFERSLRLLSQAPGVVHTKAYGADGRLLRSSSGGPSTDTPARDNGELMDALRGNLAVEGGALNFTDRPAKAEHQALGQQAGHFVELYMPVRDEQGMTVGVLEIYKTPALLAPLIEEGRRQAAWVIGLGGLLLLAGLTLLVMGADRTLRHQQRRLRETETLAVAGQLAAAVAHNVRNPLASIRSSAELAMHSATAPWQAKAESIVHDADRIGRLLQDLLRASSPQRPTALERVDLDALAAECVRELAATFHRRRQRLELRAQVRGATVMADPRALRQVLLSLLTNAIEALPAGGRCRLVVAPHGPGRYRLEVLDNGCGIPPEALRQVTEPFFTTKPNGLGLGLALVRHTVQQFGGHFSLRSRLAKGTAVCIELPAAG